jgi:hypothetical protein
LRNNNNNYYYITHQNSVLLPKFHSPEDVHWTHRESSVRIPLTAFTSLLFTPKDPSLCTRKCNIHDTPATIFLCYGNFPLVFHYHIHYHPTDVSKLENTAALSYHKRVDSYLPPSQVNVNTAPETQAITRIHHRFKIKETEVPQLQNYIVLLCRCVCACVRARVYNFLHA